MAILSREKFRVDAQDFRVSMILAILVVVGASIWDTDLQHEDAMEDFEEVQLTLAKAAARAIGAQGNLSALRDLQDEDELRFFLKRTGSSGVTDSEGRQIETQLFEGVASSGSMRLTAAQASLLGLEHGNGVAAFTRTGEWMTIVAASATSKSARRARAQLRSVVGVVVPATLIFLFGSAALRRQKKTLELQSELSLASLQRAATTGTLAIGIAHEISTPLGAIVGRAEQLLGRLKDDEKGAHAARVIVEQADHIHLVIRGILDLAHGGVPEMQLVQPEELLRRASALVEHRFAKASVSLDLRISPSLPPVRVSLQLFEHAIVNLLLNACDASKAGDVVQASVVSNEGFVEVVIRDHGIGISEANAARVFEPFFTTKPLGVGTGLGLAIANEVVKSHRGSLTIKPATSRGTEARIRVPGALDA